MDVFSRGDQIVSVSSVFLSIGSDSMPSLKAIVAKKAPFSQTGLGKKLSVEAVLNKGNDEKAPSLALKKAAT